MPDILHGPSFSQYDNPKKLIFMLHGYGDNADNFIHLARSIDQKEWKAAYIALNAPSALEGNVIGYQWFDLYPNGIYIAEAGPKEIKQILKEVHDSIMKIINTIDRYCTQLKLTYEDCILMGFSQGGMMTFEVGNFLQKKLAGLGIISGRIMQDQELTNAHLLNTPIFISHGERDEVIPIYSYHQAVQFLQTNNCNYESHMLSEDAHNISTQTITLFQNFIKKIL